VSRSSSKSSPNPIVVVPTFDASACPRVISTSEPASVTPTLARPSVSTRTFRGPSPAERPSSSTPFSHPPDRFV